MSELLEIEKFSELLDKITTRELLEMLIETIQKTDPEHSDRLIEAIQNEMESMLAKQHQSEKELENAQKEQYRWKVATLLSILKRDYMGHPLTMNAEFNEEYDDWLAPDEPEYYIEDPNDVLGLLEAIECLLLEEAWPDQWRLRLQLLEAIFNLEIDIKNYNTEPCSGRQAIDDLEMLTERGLSISKVWKSIAASALLNTQEDLDKRLATLSEKAIEYDLNLDIFTDADVNQSLDSQTKKTIATKWLDLLASKQPGNLSSVFEDGLKWIPDLELQKGYVLKMARSIPTFRKNFFETYHQSASLESQSQFIEDLLARMEDNPHQRAFWHDVLSLVEQKRGHKEKAIDELVEAINNYPTFRRYYALVSLDPDRTYVPELKSINEDQYLKSTYSVLEGNVESVLNILTPEAGPSSARRTEMTLLLCLLGHSMTHKSLCALADRFLMDGNYSSFETTALDSQKVDYSMIFGRAFDRAQLSDDDIQKALDLLNDRILEFCEEITASQARQEYFRCAQFVGALYHVRSLYGEKGLSDDFRARYGKLIKRYRRFRAEVNDWL